MRKILPVLVVLLLFTALPGPVTGPREAAAEIAPNSTATVTERLNLRSGPSLSDAVITVLPVGATVTLSGQEIGDYVFVTYGREKGWAHRGWLDIRPPATSSGTAITTDRLNLRSGPSLGDRVLTVMPQGATVTLTGQSSNGYVSVVYNGQAGWAFAAYLGGAPPPTTPTGTAIATDSLNLRAGPSLGERVITVMPAGAVVTLTSESRNGYRSVTWSGYSGWAHGDWLDVQSTPAPQPEPEPEPEPEPTSTAITTDNLNLRAGPATSFRVLTLIPRGAKVVLTGETQNSFRSVSYEGFTGWVHGEWLVPEGAAPPPTTSETATVAERLNLRTGPATSYTVLVVLPQGATVTLTGQSNNGFLSVSWQGYTGWAFAAYLDIGTTPAPPTDPPPTGGGEDAPFDVTNSIVGPTRGSADEAIAFARASGAQRMDQVERYIREVYRVGPQVGFDPAIIVAQSALETGYWKSSWWVERLNPAGIGVTGDPGQNAASPTFANGELAAHAQLAHMHAEVFGSSQPLPEILQGKDPSYQAVFAAGWAGTIRTIEDLAGTWAVDPEYDHKIVRVAREIFE